MKKTIIWFVISAAFIGPGTVTTATSAGALYGTSLLWTILFAMLACVLLQEGAARINIASGLSLGQAIVKHFGKGSKGNGIALVLTLAVVLGCAAYEAGNILGAVSGITLTAGLNPQFITLLIVVLAGSLLYTNRFNLITTFLATIIGIMGISLIVVALTLNIDYGAIAHGFVIPDIPIGSELLTLGLIGTTVVPYNLFLGSRLAEKQELLTMRRGLVLSVVLGGLISISLILIGTKVQGEFSFENVALALTNATGSWAIYFFAFGLFAAGLTSAITAPWAASITYVSTIKLKNPIRASRVILGIVLITGLIFGVSGVKPIPIIILAQAVNGVLLPFLAIAILLILNNKGIMENNRNGHLGNLALLLVIWVTGVLGLLNILKAYYASFNLNSEISTMSLSVLSVISLIITMTMGVIAYRQVPKTQ